MTRRLPPLLSPTDLPRAELDALVLDGEVYRVDECVVPLDTVPSPQLRASALAALLPGRLIVEQRSAAWVWGALDRPPFRHQVCAASGARTRPPSGTAVTAREVVIDPADLVELSGMSVTTPLRTAIDIARCGSGWGTDDIELLARLMRIGAFTIAECAQAMGRRRNLPNKVLATERLALSAAHAVDVIDRVDAPDRVQDTVEVGGVAHLEDETAERQAVA
jgi:hypothetical protein